MHNNFYLLSLILISLIFSCLTTAISLPKIIKLGEKFELRDKLSKRKQKNESLVRIGGIGMFLGFFSTLLILRFTSSFGTYSFFNLDILLPLFFSISAIFLLGLLDDIYSLSPWIRLFLRYFKTYRIPK